MTDADVFNAYFVSSKRGRRLEISRLPVEAAEAYSRYLRRARAAIGSASSKLLKLPSIYADFVTNPAFNAIAFKDQRRYFIGFNDGLPVILTIVVNRMLADDRLFPHIGDPRKENAGLPLITQLSPNTAVLSSSAGAAVPNDPLRQIYAVYLCNLAFDFLTSHEIAHIANGHIDYIDAEQGIPYLSEAEWLPNTPEGNLEAQAMELDADGTAARMLVNTVKALVATRDRMPPEIAAFYQEPTRAMYDVAVAVSVIFRLFQDSEMDGVDFSEIDHPPDRWRQMQILNMMGNFVDQFWDSSLVDPVSTAFSKAIADIENAYELITGTEQQVRGLHDAWHGVGWDYAEGITDCWNNIIRRKIANYAYIEPNSYHFDRPRTET